MSLYPSRLTMESKTFLKTQIHQKIRTLTSPFFPLHILWFSTSHFSCLIAMEKGDSSRINSPYQWAALQSFMCVSRIIQSSRSFDKKIYISRLFGSIVIYTHIISFPLMAKTFLSSKFCFLPPTQKIYWLYRWHLSITYFLIGIKSYDEVACKRIK